MEAFSGSKATGIEAWPDGSIFAVVDAVLCGSVEVYLGRSRLSRCAGSMFGVYLW